MLCRKDRQMQKNANIKIYPYASITVGEKGEALSDMEGLAPYCIAFSDDGKGVQSDDMMREAMLKAKKLGKIPVGHALLRGLFIFLLFLFTVHRLKSLDILHRNAAKGAPPLDEDLLDGEIVPKPAALLDSVNV